MILSMNDRTARWWVALAGLGGGLLIAAARSSHGGGFSPRLGVQGPDAFYGPDLYSPLIPTVATVRWTSDQVLRRILPAGAEPTYRDPSGTIRLDQVPVPDSWVGERTVKLQEQSGSRIAWIDRLGEGMLPTRETVIQEGDLLHLVMREENAADVFAVINKGPEEH